MIIDRLRHILLEEPTGALRFFFGLGAVGYAFAMPNFSDYPMYQLALSVLPAWVWSAAFAANGSALIYGSLTNKPSRLMHFLEAVLGVTVWLGMGVTTAMAQGVPGPTFFASLIAVWLYVRYPSWK